MEPTAPSAVFGGEPDQNILVATILYGGVIGAGLGLVAALFAGVESTGFVFAVSCVGLVVGGLVGGRLTTALRRTGGSRLRYSLLLPGLCVLGGGIVGLRWDVGAVALFSVFVGLGTFSIGGAIAMMVRSRYVRALCNGEPLVSWTATSSKPAKRRQYAIAGGLVVITVGSLAISVTAGYERFPSLPFFGGVIGGLLGSGARSETLHAHEDGIEVERPINRGFIPREQISGYTLSEAELRIERPYRSDYRCDPRQIEDIDAVVEGLDSHLN
jgi:hypothetical protein